MYLQPPASSDSGNVLAMH